MSKRKVLFIHETMNGGGAERVLLDLLRHMDYSRYDVTLLLVWATGVYMDQLPGQVKLLCINHDKKHWMERVLFRCKPLLDRWQRRDINRVLGNERYDTIVSFMEGPAMVYHSFVTARAVRNVTWIHTDMQHNRWTLPFHGSALREQQRYGLMDEVVLVSQGACEGFEAVINNGAHHRVLHNPIDCNAILEKSREKSVEKRRFTVCNVGRLVDEKRQDRIVRAAALLRDRGVDMDFWIVGEGRNRERLETLVVECNVADRVKLLGFKSNPYPYLAAADVFLLTSDAEGYPTVVCEALCLGRPVVSTPVAGVDELLQSGAGIVCGNDDNTIADALQRLAGNPDEVSRLVQAATACGNQFNIEATMRQVEAVINGK